MTEGAITAAEVADFLEKGLLENLVILFRSDPALYPLLGELLRDEKIAVRIGASALVESLAGEGPDQAALAAGVLLPLLDSESANVRGDAAYLLGIVGGEESLFRLGKMSGDSDGNVREAAAEAVESIEGRIRKG